MRENLTLRGHITLRLLNPDGSVADERDLPNTICDAGKALLFNGSNKLTDFAYIAIGTGSTSATSADTGLGTSLIRHSGSVTNPTPTSMKVTYTFAAGTATGSVTEAALDHASGASGEILARQTFSALDWTSDKALEASWTIS